MVNNKSKIVPTIITITIIVIIVYLFMHLEQTTIVCKKANVDDLDIVIRENLETVLDGNNISKLKLTKTIILPDKYLDSEDNYLDYINYVIKTSYKYLDSKNVEITKLDDRVIVTVDVKNKETLILNNINFIDNDRLNIKINSNTKSSDVISFKVGEVYTQRDFITRMKNNGYSCQ